ncbi:hypothetical protein [Nocardia brasiliensis]|uniref:hypothetical protein n=1 Tax=Nocardia brasiliensis TaxID=37326 RepID=UPI00367258ED
MSDEPGLFSLPDGYSAAEADLTHTERRHRLIERRIAARIHPLGYVALHEQAATGRDGDGLRCGSCRWRAVLDHHNRAYPKCLCGNGVRVTHSEASDIRAWWPACRDYETTNEEARPCLT